MFLRVFISVFLILVDCSLTTTAELSFISKANEQVRNDRRFLQKRASPPILRSKVCLFVFGKFSRNSKIRKLIAAVALDVFFYFLIF